jgi:hypothetical protein
VKYVDAVFDHHPADGGRSDEAAVTNVSDDKLALGRGPALLHRVFMRLEAEHYRRVEPESRLKFRADEHHAVDQLGVAQPDADLVTAVANAHHGAVHDVAISAKRFT